MNAAQNARRNSAHRRKKGPDYKKIAAIGVVLLVLITCIALVLKAKEMCIRDRFPSTYLGAEPKKKEPKIRFLFLIDTIC